MRAEAFVHRDGTGTFVVDGSSIDLVSAGTPAAAWREILRLAAKAAVDAERPLELEAIVDGERSVLQVSATGEIVGTAPLPAESHVAEPLPAESVARNDAHGLLAAGVRPAELLDADTLASARLRMAEQSAFGSEATPETDTVVRAETQLAVGPLMPPLDRPPVVRQRALRARRPLVMGAALALLLATGTGLALASTGHHRAASARTLASAPTSATPIDATPITPAPISAPELTTAAASTTPEPPMEPLHVTVTGRSGLVVFRVVGDGAKTATVRLDPAGQSPVEQSFDLAPSGRTTIRVRAAPGRSGWEVHTDDGRSRAAHVVVSPPAPSSTPTRVAPAPPRPQRTPTHHTPSPLPTRKPRPRSTPKPKVHASVPASPIERVSA